jgi:hypothetical protein
MNIVEYCVYHTLPTRKNILIFILRKTVAHEDMQALCISRNPVAHIPQQAAQDLIWTFVTVMLTTGEHGGFLDFRLPDSEIIQPQLWFVVLLAIILRNL